MEAPAPVVPRDNMSKTQQDRRQAAVVEAKQRAIEEARQSEIDARRSAEENARRVEEEAQKAAEEASRAEALAREKKKPTKQESELAPNARPDNTRRAEAEKQRQDAKKPSTERRGNERRRRAGGPAGALTPSPRPSDAPRDRRLLSSRSLLLISPPVVNSGRAIWGTTRENQRGVETRQKTPQSQRPAPPVRQGGP